MAMAVNADRHARHMQQTSQMDLLAALFLAALLVFLILDVLNAYFAEIAQVVHARGGVITRFQGDAVLASFNLPAADPQHARHAVEAALAIQARLAEVVFDGGIRLRTRVGISTGPVVGGTVGGGDRLGYTVHGDTVNLAARFESLNKELGSRVLGSARTGELAGDAIALRDRGIVTVRGFREPLRATPGSSSKRDHETLDRPIVGRCRLALAMKAR